MGEIDWRPLRIIWCEQCSGTFLTRSERQRLCPDCQDANSKRSSVEWRNRTFRYPESLTLTCAVCGKKVEKTGPAQKMCPECALVAKRNRDAKFIRERRKSGQPRGSGKAKPASTVQRNLKPGWCPKAEGWEPIDREVRPVETKPVRAAAKIDVSKLPMPPREATKEVRTKLPPLPSAYKRLIGNQWPPSKWERGAQY